MKEKTKKLDTNYHRLCLYVRKIDFALDCIAIVSNGITHKILHYNFCIPKFQRKTLKIKKIKHLHMTYTLPAKIENQICILE